MKQKYNFYKNLFFIVSLNNEIEQSLYVQFKFLDQKIKILKIIYIFFVFILNKYYIYTYEYTSLAL